MPQKITDELTEHIEQLVFLGKKLSVSGAVEKIEQKWLEYAKSQELARIVFWRGLTYV